MKLSTGSRPFSRASASSVPFLFLFLFLILVAGSAPLLEAQPRLTFNPPEGETLLNRPLETFRHVIRAIADHDGALWVGTYGDGLYRIGKGGLSRFTVANSPLLSDRVNCLSVRDNELWIGTCAGLNVLRSTGWTAYTTRDGVAHNIYHAVYAGPSGTMWVGTTGKGLSVFEGGRWRTYTTRDGLSSDWVNAVLETPDGIVWIATLAGVTRLRQGELTTVNPPDLPLHPNTVAIAGQGESVWFALSRGGLFLLERGTWYRPPTRLLPSPDVYALATGRDGRLYIGTAGGIGIYDPIYDFSTHGPAQGLTDPEIRTLHASADGSIWAGSRQGYLYRLPPGADRWQTVAVRGELAMSSNHANTTEPGGGT